MNDILGIDFEGMLIVIVSGDDHVVPLVVMQSSVTVAFNEVRAVTEVKHVMDVPETGEKKEDNYLPSLSTTSTSGTLIQSLRVGTDFYVVNVTLAHFMSKVQGICENDIWPKSGPCGIPYQTCWGSEETLLNYFYHLVAWRSFHLIVWGNPLMVLRKRVQMKPSQNH